MKPREAVEFYMPLRAIEDSEYNLNHSYTDLVVAVRRELLPGGNPYNIVLVYVEKSHIDAVLQGLKPPFKRTLSLNSLILWNTIYMQAALDHLHQQSILIYEEDEARLSPLLYGHVNMLGHYSFTLADTVMKGNLRPLNQPVEMIASA